MSIENIPANENIKVSQKQQQQVTPFQILKQKVYPVINNVILKVIIPQHKLIDQIVKSHQVQKHQQRLKKKKLLDQLQKKYIEREIEKEQLGSDYQQSDDQEYYKKLDMNKQQVQTIINKRLKNNKAKQQFSDKNIVENQQLGHNVFNPISFIIDQLKNYQKLKSQGKLQQYEKNNTNKAQGLLFSNTQQPTKQRQIKDELIQ